MIPSAPVKSHVLPHLRALEAESIFIFREVAAEMTRPCLLFSGGKDSTVMLAIARKAFAPAPIPFPILHVDTGLNFPEVLAYRDRWVEQLGLKLDRKSTRLNSSHIQKSRMPSSA